MTNKKFKKAAMALALTACVAAAPLAANAESPETAAEAQAPAAVDHADTDTEADAPEAEAPEKKSPPLVTISDEEPEAPVQEPEAPAVEDAAAEDEETPAAVDMSAEETPADTTEDAADEADAPAESTEADSTETPETTEIAISRPDAAVPAVQPGIAAPVAQPGGISTMLPMAGEGRQVSLNAEATNSTGTIMGDLQTVMNQVAGSGTIHEDGTIDHDVKLDKDYKGNLKIVDRIRLDLNEKTVTGTITVDLTGKEKQPGPTGLDYVEISNGTITGGTESGVQITGAEGTKILLKDLTITGNTNSKKNYGGGGVSADSGDITIDHCTITNNTASNGGGGGVSVGKKYDGAVDNASLTIKGSVISNNKGSMGGGVYAAIKDGSVEITDSTISNNSVVGQGGGIYVSASGSTDVTISDNKILENTSRSDGAGIFLSRSKQGDATPDTTISGNTIHKNTATSAGSNGGGIRLNNTSATLENNTITENTAGNAGGGIRVDATNSGPSVTCTLRGNTIANNTANTGGGISSGSSSLFYSGKYTGYTCTIIMESGSITGNKARTTLYNYGGGGVHLTGNGSRFTMKGGTISENEANCGGGIYSENYEGISILGGTIQNNKAVKHGGAIYIKNSNPRNAIDGITNTVEQEVLDIGSTVVISGNSAGQLGGGIYADNGVTVKMAGYLLNNHAGTAGDDLYLTAGSADSKNQNVLILRRVGKDDDWTLVDCDHTIDGWYIDGDKDGNDRWNADATVDADGNEIPKFIVNLDTLLDGSDYTITQDENGNYVITVGDKALALKAAHDVIPTPKPDPDPEPTPDPDPTPGPVTPENPENPPVEDATPDEPAETPVTPENPESPPVQDATPDTVSALPKTGVNWLTALAMALSGMALTVAGAFTSFAYKSKH